MAFVIFRKRAVCRTLARVQAFFDARDVLAAKAHNFMPVKALIAPTGLCQWIGKVLAFVWLTPLFGFAHGDVHARIAALTEQIAKDTNNAQLFLQRGELHREHQDWTAATADYDRAARLDPKLVAVEFCRGKMLAESGQLAAARAAFDRYLITTPADGNALLARARLLVKLGQRKPAVADFTRAAELLREPPPECFMERAQTLVADGQVDDALGGLDEGIKRLGPIITLQLYAIDLDLERKAYDQALARLETILQQASRKENWWMKRGEIELLAERPGEAKKSFEAALAAADALPERIRDTEAMQNLRKQASTVLAGLTNAPAVSAPNHAK